jgi:hypothetical protein
VSPSSLVDLAFCSRAPTDVGHREDLDPTSSRAVAEYLSVLDDAAFGCATPVEPKAISPTDPAARYLRAHFSLAGGRRGRRAVIAERLPPQQRVGPLA